MRFDDSPVDFTRLDLTPTWSAWIFYLANLGIIAGYLFASLAIARRRGAAAEMPFKTWIAGLSFFLFCGLTHVELAVHVFFQIPLTTPAGNVSWHMLLIHVLQAISIWTFLWSMRTPEPPKLPLETSVIEMQDGKS